MLQKEFENRFVTVTKIATLEHTEKQTDSHVEIGQNFIGVCKKFDNELQLKEKKLIGSRILRFGIVNYDASSDTFDTSSGKYTIKLLV